MDIIKKGDKIGNFTFLKTEWHNGKNKIWVMQCECGKEKTFWKKSAITKQKTCGCGIDKAGLTKEQRRTINGRLSSYKQGAKQRQLEWDLSYEKFVEITSQSCFYCNAEPVRINCFENAPSLQKDSPNADWTKYTTYFNGIDRLNNSLGYVENNVVPCCTYCNRAKSDLSFNDFKNHIETIYKWLNK